MPGRSPRALLLLATSVVALLALLVCAALLQPHLARFFEARDRDYEPRELVPGGNVAPSPRVAPTLESLDPAGLEAAADYAGKHGSRALIVSRHDHIVFERYWRGTSFDSPGDAQFFTRVLAALAVGVALSHRQIGWPDQPVGAFIDEWRDDPRGAITLRNLLQSTSGLTPAGAQPTKSDLVGELLRSPLGAPPGSRRREQSADVQLLALVIERATHERYAAYLSRTVWRRVGAADAFLWLDRPAGTARADCCMLAHQGDWIRIGQLLVKDGNYRGEELIRPGWVALLRAPTRADPHYGAFLRLAVTEAPGVEPYAAADLFAVEGTGGNRMWLVPSLELVVLCTGAPQGRDAAWSDSRIPNLIMRAARDFHPRGPQRGDGLSTLVPGH